MKTKLTPLNIFVSTIFFHKNVIFCERINLQAVSFLPSISSGHTEFISGQKI
ncbi:MAG: hypothetical protein RQ739_08525 [Desulfotignum sp.]|nr:hypothetical protein [Desulfotignum sp.]